MLRSAPGIGIAQTWSAGTVLPIGSWCLHGWPGSLAALFNTRDVTQMAPVMSEKSLKQASANMSTRTPAATGYCDIQLL